MSLQEYRPSKFQLLPEVIKNLLIINGLFFLATYVCDKTFGVDLIDKLGLHFIRSEKFQPYQIITYMFMHGNLTHIFFNMFALWMFGNVLENHWGAKRFITYYLICGIGAAATHYIIFYYQIQPTLHIINDYISNPNLETFEGFFKSKFFQMASPEIESHTNAFISEYNALEAAGDKYQMLQNSLNYIAQYKVDFLNASTIVGASGSVFGLLLAFGMLFPNSVIYIYFAIPMKAKYFVILYGVAELFQGVQNSQGDNVAHFAHLGGMLFGFLLIKYWQKNDRQNFY